MGDIKLGTDDLGRKTIKMPDGQVLTEKEKDSNRYVDASFFSNTREVRLESSKYSKDTYIDTWRGKFDVSINEPWLDSGKRTPSAIHYGGTDYNADRGNDFGNNPKVFHPPQSPETPKSASGPANNREYEPPPSSSWDQGQTNFPTMSPMHPATSQDRALLSNSNYHNYGKMVMIVVLIMAAVLGGIFFISRLAKNRQAENPTLVSAVYGQTTATLTTKSPQPQHLISLHIPFESRCYETISNFTMRGMNYATGFKLYYPTPTIIGTNYISGYAYFNIGAKYKKMSLTYGHIDGTDANQAHLMVGGRTQANFDLDDDGAFIKNVGNIAYYENGFLLKQDFSSSDAPRTLTFDVTDIVELAIVVINSGEGAGEFLNYSSAATGFIITLE